MGSHTSFIGNVNIFWWVFLGLLLLVLLRVYIIQRLSQRTLAAWLRISYLRFLLRPQLLKLLVAVTAVAFVLSSLFEVYYVQGRCGVSDNYYNYNKNNAVRIIDFLSKHGQAFWPDGASLLNVLRKEEINPWDHDVDFSMIHPGDAKLKELMASLSTDPEFWINYLPARGLLQIFPAGFKSGPHTDILFWREQVDEASGETVLVSDEYTLRVKEHKKSDIFPLQEATWLAGRKIPIPAKSHEMSLAEYGESYVRPVVFRLDCLENLIHGRTFL